MQRWSHDSDDCRRSIWRIMGCGCSVGILLVGKGTILAGPQRHYSIPACQSYNTDDARPARASLVHPFKPYHCGNMADAAAGEQCQA